VGITWTIRSGGVEARLSRVIPPATSPASVISLGALCVLRVLCAKIKPLKRRGRREAQRTEKTIAIKRLTHLHRILTFEESRPAMSADPWRPLRVWRRMVIGLWLGWLPFAALLIHLQETVLRPPWAVYVGVGYLSLFLICGVCANLCRCPKCGERFGRLVYSVRERFSLPSRAPWAWRCDKCDTPLGDPI